MSAFFEKPHRRFNPLTNEWVLVSPHRTKRPWQGKEEDKPHQSPTYDPQCYLCPGNTRSNGIQNEQYTSTYSFQNDFSALLDNQGDEIFEEGLLKGRIEEGVCKVICFSPDHSLTMAEMSIDSLVDVIRLWKKEFSELGALPFINNVQIFENKGAIMGCSNPHPHGQIWSQNSIPEEIRKRVHTQEAHYKSHSTSLLGDYVLQELAAGERVVYENDHFVTVVPFWAIWPFETMIIPKRHYHVITDMTEQEEEAFARALSDITIKYDNLFQTSFPYSAGAQQCPTDGNEYRGWHFHYAFYPPLLRSATVKKFMVGYEMFANPQRDITPETAAAMLRAQSAVHYKQAT